MSPTLRETGEDALLARLLKSMPMAPSPAGPGDDCAVLDISPSLDEVFLLKTDAIASGIHFLPDAPARLVGRKAASRVISDIAAMGGTPLQLLVTIALPPETRLDWVELLYLGIHDRISACGAALAGGETVSLPPGSAGVISVAGFGQVSRRNVITRCGARVGDEIWVTGTLGGSISGKHLDFQPRLAEARWLVEQFRPTAMMDLSDGLAKDLPRLASASGVGFEIEPARLPCTPGCGADQALGDGEDYELLFTMPAMTEEVGKRFRDAWTTKFSGLPVTCIGAITTAGQGRQLTGGWEHFSQGPSPSSSDRTQRSTSKEPMCGASWIP
jgi:thiamine-monophosphate kinase